MSKKKLVEKALQAAMEARAERYVADPAERAANLAKWQAQTPAQITEPTWYHGTFTDVENLRPGLADATFLSKDPDFANRYATPADKGPSADWDAVNKVWVSRESLPSAPNVMPFHVRAENPFDYDNKAHIAALKKRFQPDPNDPNAQYYVGQSSMGDWSAIENPEIQKVIRDLGHDSFYVMEDGSKNLAVYDPTRQLKSATGNTGLFDPNIPRIDENRGGAVEREHHADGERVTGEVKFDPRELVVPPQFRPMPQDAGISVGSEGKRQLGEVVSASLSPTINAGPVSGGPLLVGVKDFLQPIVGYQASAALPEGFRLSYGSSRPLDVPSKYSSDTLSLAKEILGTQVAARMMKQADKTGYGASLSRGNKDGATYFSVQRPPMGGISVMGGREFRFADGGEVYQSTGEKLIGDEGKINWGDPNEARDFFRADAEMMRRRRAEEEATRKIDREAITVSSLPAPGSTDQPSAPVPVAAARESDVSPYAVLPLIRQAESSNDPMAQNKASTAGGLYQFIDETWASALRRMDPERYGRMSTAQLAALKKGAASVPIQERAARFHLEKDIVPTLEGAKIPVNPATIYLSWFQGPQGAVTAYKAPGSAMVKDLFPKTVGPNERLQYRGKPYAEWTRDDLVNWANETMTRRMRGRAEGGPIEEREGHSGGKRVVDKAMKAVSDLLATPEMARWREGSAIPSSSMGDRYFTGTSKDTDFSAFKVGRHGAWFTKDPAEASSYAKENDSKGYKLDGWKTVPVNTADRVIPAFLRAENPFTGSLPEEVKGENYKRLQSQWFDTLRQQGYDAWMPESAPNLAVILKEPSQIKSAISNTGDFDPAQSRIDRADGGEVESKTLTEAMLGSNPELPRGELTMSAPPETSLVQRALHALPSFGSYGRAIGEELNAPRRALDVARQINAQSEGIDPDAAKLAALGALGYAISPITAAQNVLIRDPLLKAGAPMDMAQRGVNVSDALGLAGAIKAGAKKAVKKGVTESSALGSGAATQAQLLGGGYLTSPGLPDDRDGKASGGSSEIGTEGFTDMREHFDKGGKKIAKSIKSATDQARRVFPELATRYPEVAPPVEAIDRKTGKPYLAKELSEEAKAVQLARKVAQERIDRGEYTPFFDPAKRFDVDITQYPAYEPTITQRRVKPETQEKYDSMLMAEDVLARLDDAYKRGLLQKQDAENWYMLGQVEAEFIKEFGEKVGRERFKERIADAMAATTGGADPESNWLMAQYGNFMKQQGAEMPKAAYEFPFPIGGRYVSGNMDQYRKMIMEGEGVTPDNPKRYNFSYNFLGSKAPTIDEQMMGIIRPGVNVPEPGTYGHHEAPVTAAAARQSVDPRYYQEVAWAGAKDAKTKGGFKAAPFIDTINESIERTSQVTGLPPEEVVRKGLVRSEMPMYGAAGATVGAGALSESGEGEPRAKGGTVVSKALMLTSKKAKR